MTIFGAQRGTDFSGKTNILIIRPTGKLAKKIKVNPQEALPATDDPFLDWSARLFNVGRTQHVMLSNTASLYSVVMLGAGVIDLQSLTDRAIEALAELMASDGLGRVYERHIVPAWRDASVSKALSRSITGSMNDLEACVAHVLEEQDMSLTAASQWLNEMPLSTLDYASPKAVFAAMAGDVGIEIKPRAAAGKREPLRGSRSVPVAFDDDSDASPAPLSNAAEQPDELVEINLEEMLAEVDEAYRDRFLEIVHCTDRFCDEHLNNEYKQLSRIMATLVCTSGSPARQGKPESWAAGVVYALGRVNFLHDPSQSPHMKPDDVARGIGVSPATMHAKTKAITDGLGLTPFDPDWTLPSRMADNPLIWMLKVNGLVMDIRMAPRGAQVVAYEQGLIPYIPADDDDGSYDGDGDQ